MQIREKHTKKKGEKQKKKGSRRQTYIERSRETNTQREKHTKKEGEIQTNKERNRQRKMENVIYSDK